MIYTQRSQVLFQSTLPRGERPVKEERVYDRENFNPRSRVGSDYKKSEGFRYIEISIHAPAWGATSNVLVFCKAEV